MSTLLDPGQIFKIVFDEATGCIKTVPGSSSAFSIELSHVDGDSVSVYSGHLDNKFTVAPGATLEPIYTASGESLRKISLTLKSEAALSVAAAFKLQVSPSAVDDVWIDVAGSTLSSSLTNGAVVAGAVSDLICARFRLVLTAAPVGGSVSAYIVAKGA